MVDPTIKAGIPPYLLKMGSDILTVHLFVRGKEIGGIVLDRKAPNSKMTRKAPISAPFMPRPFAKCEGFFMKFLGDFLK
jgi:hypothetical protein